MLLRKNTYNNCCPDDLIVCVHSPYSSGRNVLCWSVDEKSSDKETKPISSLDKLLTNVFKQ